MNSAIKIISRYYHSIIAKTSEEYQNINNQTNDILSLYFDKPQYCTLVPLPVFLLPDKNVTNAESARYMKIYYLSFRLSVSFTKLFPSIRHLLCFGTETESFYYFYGLRLKAFNMFLMFLG